MPIGLPDFGSSSVDIGDTVIIRSESDFPTPSGGIITLDSVGYHIVGSVDIANILKPPTGGDTYIFSENPGSSFLNYTGTSALFENAIMDGAFLFLDKIRMTATSGQVFNLDATTTAFVVAIACIYSDIDTLGTIKNIGCTLKFSSFRDFGQGFVFDGLDDLTFSENFISDSRNEVGSDFITIIGAHASIQINDNFLLTSGVNETILHIDNTSTTIGAVCVGNDFDVSAGGVLFDPAEKDQSDPDWNFSGNTGVSNSATTGGASLNVPQTVAIGTATTFERVDDTNTSGTNVWTLIDTERFSLDTTTGRFTYTGNPDVAIEIICTGTIEKSGGGSDEIGIAIGINGTVDIISLSTTQNSLPTTVVALDRKVISNGDFIEIFAVNNSTTADVIINRMVVSIR